MPSDDSGTPKEGFFAKHEREQFEGAVLYAEKNGLLGDGKVPCPQISAPSPGLLSSDYLLKSTTGELICKASTLDIVKANQDKQRWEKEKAESGAAGISRRELFGEPRRDQWEYLFIRYASAGTGDKNEMDFANINGVSLMSFALVEGLKIRTVADLLNAAGDAGWELVNHSPLRSSQFHFLVMKRRKNLPPVPPPPPPSLGQG